MERKTFPKATTDSPKGAVKTRDKTACCNESPGYAFTRDHLSTYACLLLAGKDDGNRGNRGLEICGGIKKSWGVLTRCTTLTTRLDFPSQIIAYERIFYFHGVI
ncbi:hypothetical protein NPIL_275351 [Nephila pilipes]|uniref:Uncharacterized protein n=1 Tax=Nephila pilipes TaxID=299642 RepID=A0A8X6QIG2_NEPPI|nr:hypothetical protein NPIL_275351 [Nephila pilipes]